MKVLDYKLDNLYHIQVQTQEIRKSWDKFCARITHPEQYCKYSANSNGTLSLYNYETGLIENIENGTWSHSRPVFYETCEYSFVISFPNILKGTVPYIIHENALIESLFNGIEARDEYILAGNINFLNQPGRFSLNFSFTTTDGKTHNEILSFDVVSPKLDTKNDLNTIIKEIKAEYNDIVFRYLTLTFQQFSLGKEANNDLIWLSIFKQIIDNYILSIKHIINRPHNKHINTVEYLRPDKIKKWTNRLAEEHKEDFEKDASKSLKKYYRNEVINDTFNTIENRFIKYTIECIYERLCNIFSQIESRRDASESEINRLQNIKNSLNALRQNGLFKTIGRFEGFKQESLVLQQRSGYTQIYRYWILLQRGLDLIDGDTSVGVQPVWKLYELWCFLKVKRLIAEVLGLDMQNPEHLQYVHEDTTNTTNPFAGGDLTGTIKYENPKNGDVIEVGYQYSFNYKGNQDGFRSMTVEQRPDIVVHIHKKNDITLTYLFDAKYRVQGDDDPSQGDVMDYPIEDTLNQMHRYRDAIYYSNDTNSNYSKEVVGGYILFPGRLEEHKCQHLLDIADYDNQKLPYYLRSIETINIGAFPLLPNENSGYLLKKFLEKVIIREDTRTQIEDSIPQRGLFYSVENTGTNILIASYKDYNHKVWIERNHKYGLCIDNNNRGILNLNSNYANINYLLLYKAGETDTQNLYKIIGDPEIITDNDMVKLDYNSPEGNLFLLYSLEDQIDSRLIGRKFVIDEEFATQTDGRPYVIKYINLFPPEEDIQ